MSSSGHVSPSTTASPQSQKKRSPIERMIIWGGIIVLFVFTLWEAKQKYSYSPSLERIKKILDSEGEPVQLSAVRLAISGSPKERSYPDPELNRNRKIEFRWPSFVKDYRIEITVAKEGDDPLVEGFTTPDVDSNDGKSSKK